MANTAYGPCRSLGHSWQRRWTIERERGNRAATLVLQCDGCDTTRRDLFDARSGTLLKRKYTYPTGYLWRREDPETEAPTRADYRSDWLTGLLKGGARVVNISTASRQRRAS